MSFGPFSTSNRLNISSALVSAAPLSMSCWAYPTSFSGYNMFVCIGRTSATTHRFCINSAITSGKLSVSTADGSYREALSAAALNLNAWNHCGGVWASATSRKAYLNGVGPVENTTSATPTSMVASSVGIHTNSTDNAAAALVGEVGIWNAALTDDEMTALSKGISPQLIRPESLVAHLPLVRNLVDLRGNAWTESGTVPRADHPRIIMPIGAIR